MDDQAQVVKVRWRGGVIAALAMMVLSCYPQVHFWIVRGNDWNGSYAAIEGVGDEVAYSAYVNALIDGRPRRNDPYTGRDFTSDSKQRDSLFSIQFVPAYLIALPARVLGMSAATAFILLSPLAAGSAALAIFWLISIVTRDERVSAAGAIIVLCLGTVVGGHGQVTTFFGQDPLYNYLMFLRRYQPAASFPLFIMFCGTFVMAITSRNRKTTMGCAIAAAIIFSLLVFSYVYLWTAAVAWGIALLLLWVMAKPEGWRNNLPAFAVVGFGGLAALTGFVLYFSNRAPSMDSVQALEISHAPDLLRLPCLLGIAVLVLLASFARRQQFALNDRRVLLAASFALLSLLVFNQQVLTGHSLQPLHYEMFVANYSVLISVVIAATLILKMDRSLRLRMPKHALLWITLLAFEWGCFETIVATRGSMSFDHDIDDGRAVAKRLVNVDAGDSTMGERAILLSTDLLVADSLPSSAPQAVLWAPHMLVFSGASVAETKERFYQYLYYSGISPERLRTILRKEARYGFAVGMFGFERTIRGLSHAAKPISNEEFDAEVKKYEDYVASFSSEQANRARLSYVVAPLDESPDFTKLDHWYERDAGERVGKFVLYRVRFRDQEATSRIR